MSVTVVVKISDVHPQQENTQRKNKYLIQRKVTIYCKAKETKEDIKKEENGNENEEGGEENSDESAILEEQEKIEIITKEQQRRRSLRLELYKKQQAENGIGAPMEKPDVKDLMPEDIG
ncbi:hypothetical protein BDC45DRAFT_570738 [Circinella umbellata]|nr:hypothetical protein BDC45DRAFT_570738 [Circinella umbellata]